MSKVGSCICRGNPAGRFLVEIIDDAVGDCLGEAVLEGTVSQQGGLAAVREVAHLDKDGGAASSGQDVVTGCLNSKAVQTCAGHRTGNGIRSPA